MFPFRCGTRHPAASPIIRNCLNRHLGGTFMHSIIYLVGLVVVVLAILSFLGLR